MLIKNKKGFEAGTLVIMISVLVGFVLIATIIFGFQSKAEAKETELLCKESIDWRAATTINAGGADLRLIPPLCDTIDVEVTGSREEIKEQMAYLMARCWYMFGEGRYEELLSSPNAIRNAFGLTKSKNDCFMCYTAVIDQKKIENGVIGMNEMFTYLREKDHRDIKGTTYLDYIQSYGGPGQPVVMNDIAPREAYGIVFMAKNKEGDGSGWWKSALAIGAGVGFVACSVATWGACAIVAAGATIGAGSVVGAVEYFSNPELDVSVITLANIDVIEAGGCAVRSLQ